MLVYVSLCGYMHTSIGTQVGQGRRISLELELQGVVCYPVIGSGIQTQVLFKSNTKYLQPFTLIYCFYVFLYFVYFKQKVLRLQTFATTLTIIKCFYSVVWKEQCLRERRERGINLQERAYSWSWTEWWVWRKGFILLVSLCCVFEKGFLLCSLCLLGWVMLP